MPGWGAYVPPSEYRDHIANYVDDPKVSNVDIYLDVYHSLDF